MDKVRESNGSDAGAVPGGIGTASDPARVSPLRAVNRWLGRINITAATAILAVFILFWSLAGAALMIESPMFAAKWQQYAGVVVLTLMVSVPICYSAQRIIRQLTASREALRQMTERLAWALERAEQASEEKSRFLAKMSHELRTPLNAIIGFSDMIANERLGPMQDERYRNYAVDINGSGQHLLGIINEILDLAKIEAGEMRVDENESCDVGDAIAAAGRMVAPAAARRGIDLTLLPSPSRIRLRAVDRMLRQILINVLANAVKFTPPGGNVLLTPELRPHGNLVLIVSDTGIGMTREEIRLALTPFGQVGHAQHADQNGTGLGLPLARAMIELHGGRLSVRSTPGKGTTVALIFPASRVEAAIPNITPLPAIAASGRTAAPGNGSADIIPLSGTISERRSNRS